MTHVPPVRLFPVLSLLINIIIASGYRAAQTPTLSVTLSGLLRFCEMYVKRAQKNIPVRGIPLFVSSLMSHVPCPMSGNLHPCIIMPQKAAAFSCQQFSAAHNMVEFTQTSPPVEPDCVFLFVYCLHFFSSLGAD